MRHDRAWPRDAQEPRSSRHLAVCARVRGLVAAASVHVRTAHGCDGKPAISARQRCTVGSVISRAVGVMLASAPGEAIRVDYDGTTGRHSRLDYTTYYQTIKS